MVSTQIAVIAPFDRVPNEIIEHVAFFTATLGRPGPPADLISLQLVSRRFASTLSTSTNPHFYVLIFRAKFDAEAYFRRLGPEAKISENVVRELKRRFTLLTRFRGLQHSKVTLKTKEMLWMAYLMMLENDGLNERTLRKYGRLDSWLRNFWFDPEGASFATYALGDNLWPPDSEFSTLAMWLFWLLLKPEEYLVLDEQTFRSIVSILKLIALGAHKYPVTQPEWIEFLPPSPLRNTTPTSYASYPLLVAPPLAAPAILSYLSLAPKSVNKADTFKNSPLAPSGIWQMLREEAEALSAEEEDAEAFKLGNLDGVWEGLFTYTEFTAYAALLSGAPPPTLHRTLVARHQQTWKLREYHLLGPEEPNEPQSGNTNSNTNNTAQNVPDRYRPLSMGDPLRAYLPTGVDISRCPGLLSVPTTDPPNPLTSNASPPPTTAQDEIEPVAQTAYQRRVRDVLIKGEGHSAWGQFKLVGRVRPYDGFVSLSKEYLDGDRGKWLYRGFLVGDKYGSFTGRWRDTLSPAAVPGYEGCFFMGRRRGGGMDV
ncbi:uncharacterized protein STEHIDRAFT_69028 [Stereum hirsutum FP-91666 SS1]|uniref:F-box domain-containing protein n=1 Tax=Stereum hirsutum (strain FP-91666) TaxID=721885 RepID=R7RWV0_STEHR|nr:uncharacterized protein STEHIDRAFT_69028 [Stereum hirsutum FP-91666 SS1]EIM79856.1 hypothetical protein STEHIDRAFT_69028 [Stereum hirsutum FP-91666 SS1]